MINFKKHQLILASQSPRRTQLLKDANIDHAIVISKVEEIAPDDMDLELRPAYIAGLKADAVLNNLNGNVIVLAADTSVFINNKILNKPKDHDHAVSLLTELSGKEHKVITGVVIKTHEKEEVFSVSTSVFMNQLSMDEINYYINHYKPFDKAGSYGMQDWIGVTKVEKIEGSYSNIIGLPMETLYPNLIDFLKGLYP